MGKRLIKSEPKNELASPIEESGIIFSSGRSGDEVQESKGPISLKCLRCNSALSFTRNCDATLQCNKCGSDQFLALSNFIMTGYEQVNNVKVGDVVKDGRIWNIV